ncbi:MULTISPECIES: MinD/ParA family protein [Mycobacteriaceae]|nr:MULTISPECIES: hypothetical protein [Mycobacteriaceae]MCG7594744.1 hypothetical protein [Mycobacterium sp. PSTR-4-N]
MSMDPDFQARYLDERDADEGTPGWSVEHEPDIGGEPQAPATPSLPEPTVPYAEQRPGWAETTQAIDPAVLAAARAARHYDAPQRPADGRGEGRDDGPRHRGPATDGRGYQSPAVPERSELAQPSSGPMSAVTDAGQDMATRVPERHRPTAQSFAAPRGRGPADTGYEVARREAPASWEAARELSFAPSQANDSDFSNAPALRAEDVVAARKLPPEMGWRKTVYVGSGKTINLGAGPAEQRLREQIDLIKTNIPGNYLIGVVCVRGGVGKTRMTAGVGTAYAKYRTEPVIAIDANPTYGALGRLIDPTATASIRDFLADGNLNTYPMARHYTGKNGPGLEVLGANQNVAHPFDLSPQAFTAVLDRVRRFYQLALIDCGPEIEHPVMQAVLSKVDALIIVGTMNFDGAAAAETTIKWLAARSEYQALLRRSALVLNDVYNCANKDFLAKVRETMGQRVGGVTTVPWDKDLRDNPQLDFDALRRDTQYAFMDVAAWLAQGFRSGRTAQR